MSLICRRMQIAYLVLFKTNITRKMLRETFDHFFFYFKYFGHIDEEQNNWTKKHDKCGIWMLLVNITDQQSRFCVRAKKKPLSLANE